MNVPTIKAALVSAALLLGLSLSDVRSARAVNDHIFPAAPAAHAFSDFDARGFLINGKRTFLVSASMEYARVPRALWRDRLLRLKRAGFNCVEMYNFWDWHEPKEGQFDFTGDHDLDAYLKLVKSLGMYAICRVGPYYCAEWDNGGYPVWLNFKPGLGVREDNAVFLAAVDKFWDKLLPIVAANQINKGGSVILVQLENEHPLAWGTDEPNPYFKHLQDKAVAMGIEVPYFFSGLHHANDPAGRAASLDDPARPNPWFTTEFWSVWYDHYGPGPTDPATYDRRTWKIIAHGGNGYNIYLVHGGSNFAYTNDDEDAASYDYGAAVGQAGDLRPLYYTFKRAAWFARSFQDILENSVDDTAAYQTAATNPAVQVTARKSPAGTIVFLDNPTNAPVQTQIKGADGTAYPVAGPITIAPGEIMPIVMDTAIAPGVTLSLGAARILGVVPQGSTTTLVVTGPAGEHGELRFSGGQTIPLTFDNNVTITHVAGANAQTVRVLSMASPQSDCLWPVEVGGQTDIVCGPAYIGDAKLAGGKLTLTAEHPWQAPAPAYPGVAYGSDDTPLPLRRLTALADHPATPKLGAWQTLDASAPAAPNFNDAAWMASDAPLPMGADGDITADAWYRAKLPSLSAGAYALQFGSLSDRAEAFMDGKALGDASSGIIPLTLTPGAHTLAIFTAHDGRPKLYNHLGAIDMADPKGLTGPALLLSGPVSTPPLSGWRILTPTRAPSATSRIPNAGATGWTDYAVGTDAFNARRGAAWFQTTLPTAAGAASLHLEGVGENATVFLNGQNIGHHAGRDQAFDVPVGRAFKPAGPNVLTLLIQSTGGGGGIDKPVSIITYASQTPVIGWKLRGGPGEPLAPNGWAALASGKAFEGPQFFRTTFTAAPPPAVGPHPIWRVIPAGLGHGNVWVNGHNLGRYPEKIPVNGLYVPECWLTTGTNSLVIYDEDGHRPDGVTLQVEPAASRDIVELTAATP